MNLDLCLKSLLITPLSETAISQAVTLDLVCLGGLWSEAGYRRELASPNSTLTTITSLAHPGQIISIGCVWAILEEAHVTLMAVHPDFQRQGIGQLLLWTLLRDAWLRGLERATLEVRASNAVAIALYGKFGFAVAGHRKGYYKETGEDALIMWRKGLAESSFPDELQRWQQQIGDRLRQHHWCWSQEKTCLQQETGDKKDN